MAQPPLILVIDDDRRITDALQVRVRLAGYRVLIGRDGRDGLEAALAHDPDCIITDIAMPEMDGDTLIRRLNERGVIETTPVIVLSAAADDRSRRIYGKLGVRHVGRKPSDGAEPLALVEAAVPGERLGAACNARA